MNVCNHEKMSLQYKKLSANTRKLSANMRKLSANMYIILLVLQFQGFRGFCKTGVPISLQNPNKTIISTSMEFNLINSIEP